MFGRIVEFEAQGLDFRTLILHECIKEHLPSSAMFHLESYQDEKVMSPRNSVIMSGHIWQM